MIGVLHDGVDRGLFTMGEELVAKHLEVPGLVVVGIRCAVHAGESVSGGDPAKESPHVRDAQVAGGIGEDDGIHRRQRSGRQLPPHVVSGIPQIITLQQAVLIAYARSPLLAQARAQVAISSAPLSLAESAIFPLVTGTVTQDHTHRQSTTVPSSATGAVVGNLTSPTVTTNSLNTTITQLIFDGGRVAETARRVSQGVRNGERKAGVQDGHTV